MRSESTQRGQVEVCTVHHNDHAFTNFGSSVHGDRVTGYLTGSTLSRWSGSTMLDCRMTTFRSWQCWDGITDVLLAIGWQLTGGRWIVGYALGEGMLFRGCLVHCDDENEAKREAVAECEYWQRIDQNDEESWEHTNEDR